MTPQFRLKRRNRIRQISDHRQIAGTYAIQLRRINFKVNDLGMRRESRRIARHAIIEPRPKYHQQIGLMQRRVRRPRSVHADHAQVIRRLRRNRAQSMNCGKCRNIQLVEQPPQLRDRSRQLRPRAHQRNRLRSLLQQRYDRVGEAAVGFRIGRPRVRRELHRPGKFLLGLQHVGGDVDHYRPRTPAACPVKSFGDRLRNFVNRADQPAPLGQRERHAKNVRLLKRIGPDQRAAHLPGDAHQGNRIHLRVGNAGDQIRRAGPARGHGNAHFARNPRITFRRENRALLVPRKDVPHSAAFQRVVQRHDRAAGIAKHQLHPFGAQALQDDVGSLMHSPPVWCRPSALPPASCLPSAASSSCRAAARPRSRWDAASLSRAAY